MRTIRGGVAIVEPSTGSEPITKARSTIVFAAPVALVAPAAYTTGPLDALGDHGYCAFVVYINSRLALTSASKICRKKRFCRMNCCTPTCRLYISHAVHATVCFRDQLS